MPRLLNIVTKYFILGLKRKLQAYHSSDEEEGGDDAPVKKNKKPVMGQGYDPLALIKVSFTLLLGQVKETKFPVSPHFHNSFSPFSSPCGGL